MAKVPNMRSWQAREYYQSSAHIPFAAQEVAGTQPVDSQVAADTRAVADTAAVAVELAETVSELADPGAEPVDSAAEPEPVGPVIAQKMQGAAAYQLPADLPETQSMFHRSCKKRCHLEAGFRNWDKT